jgi:hypothetical protein
MATDTWLDSEDNWTNASDWSDGVPTRTSAVVIDQGGPLITAPISASSVTMSPDGGLDFVSAGTSTISGDVTGGFLTVDYNSGGGTEVNIGGALNVGDGAIGDGVTIGDFFNSLSANDGITAARLNNVGGAILLNGTMSPGPLYRATLDIKGSVDMGAGAGVLTGDVGLDGDSLLEFGGGQVTTIAADGVLGLSGPDAYVADAGSLSSNSALLGLRTNDGRFTLDQDEQVTTTGPLNNAGRIYLDPQFGGGSDLTVGGALTNSGELVIGNSFLTSSDGVTARALDNTNGTIVLLGGVNSDAASQAKVDIEGSASLGASPGVLTGNVALSGDSLIEFGSGQITTIAADGSLSLDPDSLVADAGDPSRSSALKGLRTIDGQFAFGGQQIATTGALDNAGTLDVGPGTDTVTSLAIGGALTDSGFLSIGADSNVTATAVNNVNGNITLYGDSLDVPSQSALDISGPASLGASRGVLSGDVLLEGNSLIAFGGGQITTITANGNLRIFGPEAFIADAGALSSNSALQGLSRIYGTLDIEDDTQIATTGGLNNAGTLSVDTETGTGTSGSNLNIGGELTNSGTLNIGEIYPSGPSSVTAESLNNSGGTITLNDAIPTNSGEPAPSSLVINGAAKNTGTVNVQGGDLVTIGGALSGSGTVNLSNDGLPGNSGTLSVGSLSCGQTVNLDDGLLSLGAGGSGGTIAFGGAEARLILPPASICATSSAVSEPATRWISRPLAMLWAITSPMPLTTVARGERC